MDVIENLSNSFEASIKDSNLQNITVDLAEAFSDSLIKDGILKDIPIFGSILNLAKFTLTIRDQLFVKKLIYFFKEFNQILPEKRSEMISSIDNSDKTRMKIGEKLLYIVDRCDDHINADYTGKFFRAFLIGTLSYSEFLRCSHILQNVFIGDFEYFLQNENLERHAKMNDYFTDVELNLVSAGLCGKIVNEISIRDQDDWKMADQKYIVEQGGEVLYITDIGKKIHQVLSV